MVKILVVEDEGLMATEIKNTLQNLGYSVPAVASNGEEAIKRAAEVHPDLVLIDIILKSEMDGVKVAEQIDEHFDIPVVYLTAHSDENILQRAMKSKHFGFILKPFDERELRTAIEIAIYKHKKEKELRESHEWFATTLKSIGDAVIATDEKGSVTFMNSVAEVLTGWKQEEALGKPLEDVFNIINEKTGNRTEDPVTKVLREGAIVGLANDTVLIAKDGTKLPITDSGAPIKDNRGNIIGTIMVFHDITESKLAEEFIKNILESMGEGFVVVDRQYRIITANKAYCQQVKMPVEDITGKHCYKISHQIDKPCHEVGEKCAIVHTFETGENSSVLHIHHDKEGNPLYVEIKSYPIRDTSGNITSVIEVLNNISERVKLEEQLRQAQKMEAVGQLAGGIAHDFNNILTAIIGYGNLVQIKMNKNDPLRNYLEQMIKSAEKASDLTRSLLAFSRKQIINPQPLNLNDMINKAEVLISRLIGEDIELKTILPDEDVTVMADEGQLEQALINLVTNARDAMPEGGFLIVETEVTELDDKFIKTYGFGVTGKYAHISVTDTGVGLDEETKERIFEPFFTTKETGKGTGLGLSMVYGIIKQHNGYINLHSELGRGTTFRIYLPIIDEKVQYKKIMEHQAIQGGTETVLLAEDDEDVRKLIKDILEKFGYKVIVAVDGEDAFDKFIENKHSIQILLLDLIMPRKNGKKVYSEIKEIKPDIKALFLSGYSANLVHRKGVLEEDLNFIFKPVSVNDLLINVREILDK